MNKVSLFWDTWEKNKINEENKVEKQLDSTSVMVLLIFSFTFTHWDLLGWTILSEIHLFLTTTQHQLL